jgi:hypothetical protein
MIEVIPATDPVLAFRFSGTITGEDYDKVIQAVEDKLKDHQQIGIYADMIDFTDMSAGALAKDFRYAFAKLGEWRRFPRAALVTDKQWIRGLVRVLDPLLPKIEARAFAAEERDAAMDWVKSAGPTAH